MNATQSKSPHTLALELASILTEHYKGVPIGNIHLAIGELYIATGKAWMELDKKKSHALFAKTRAKQTYENLFEVFSQDS